MFEISITFFLGKSPFWRSVWALTILPILPIFPVLSIFLSWTYCIVDIEYSRTPQYRKVWSLRLTTHQLFIVSGYFRTTVYHPMLLKKVSKIVFLNLLRRVNIIILLNIVTTKFENQLVVVCWFSKSSIPYVIYIIEYTVPPRLMQRHTILLKGL